MLDNDFDVLCIFGFPISVSLLEYLVKGEFVSLCYIFG